jgi:hypothetical protein
MSATLTTGRLRYLPSQDDQPEGNRPFTTNSATLGPITLNDSRNTEATRPLLHREYQVEIQPTSFDQTRIQQAYSASPSTDGQSIGDSSHSTKTSVTSAGSHSRFFGKLKTKERNHSLPKREGYSFFVEWRWELITWILGTVAIAVNLVLLCYFKDKSLAYWHSKIQISSIVASLSQVAQSSLMVSVGSCIGQFKWSLFSKTSPVAEVERFDDASRGPQGSLKLLFHTVLKPKSPEGFGLQG